jgi:hypothetical protein
MTTLQNFSERIALARVLIAAMMMHNDKRQRYTERADVIEDIESMSAHVLHAAMFRMIRDDELTIVRDDDSLELTYSDSLCKSLAIIDKDAQHEDDRKHELTETYSEHLNVIHDVIEEQREQLVAMLADIDTQRAELQETKASIQEHSETLDALKKLTRAVNDADSALKKAQTITALASRIALDTIEDDS